jgi:site-specific recombinase XerD
MASVKLILNHHKTNSKGEVPLYIRIIQNRKPKYISLGISVIPEKHWDFKTQQVKRPFPNTGRTNNYIARRMAEAQDTALKLQNESRHVSSRAIKEKLVGRPPESFIGYSEKQIERLEISDQIRTAIRYKSVTNKLKVYLKKKEFTFDDFTVTFLYDYEAYLRSLGNKTNTIHSNLKTLRAILYKAIREDVFAQEKNPFFKFKLKSAPTQKERLSLDEIELLHKVELPEGINAWHVRYAFLLSFYCAGIRIGDLIQLKWSNISGDFLSYSMDKTESYRKIKLIRQAKEILNLYKEGGTPNNHFIFPFLKNDVDYSSREFLMNQLGAKTAKINYHLKHIAQKAGIDKRLTSHIARHSFADIARKKGVSVYDISKALGHTNISITQSYLASFDDGSLESAMEKIFG